MVTKIPQWFLVQIFSHIQVFWVPDDRQAQRINALMLYEPSYLVQSTQLAQTYSKQKNRDSPSFKEYRKQRHHIISVVDYKYRGGK